MFPEYYNRSTLSTPLPTPGGCHMTNFIRQNEAILANEPLKVEKPFLESSSEMDNFQCITNTEHSPDTKITVMGIYCSRILCDGEFQLTEPWSPKIFTEEAQKEIYTFTERSGKNVPEKTVQKIFEHL